MRRLFLRDCAPGDLVEDVFIITNKQLAATSAGKYFIKAFCSDRTGQFTARVWNATRDMFNAMPEAGFLRIRGRVENYQNNLQLIIEQMWAAKEGSFEIADLMPHTERDVDQMFGRVVEICGSIGNRHLAALLEAYLADEKLMADFRRAPAAMSFHHAFLGGLLEHTLNAMEVADAVCRFYPKLNRDLVVSGIFLHDLAKTWELCYDSAFGYTDAGQLVGHVVKGAIWVEKKAEEAGKLLGEPIPRTLIDVVQHIILSLDAKLMMALQMTRGDAAMSEANWTEYLKAFNGRLFRPDVAPAQSGTPSPPVEPPTAPTTDSAGRPVINNPLFESSPARKR
jgi:3'-5' exoribonuclease